MPLKFAGWLKGLWDGIRNLINAPWQKLKTFFTTDVKSWITGLPAKITSWASGMWDGITSAFRTAINAAIGVWNKLRLTITFPDNLGGVPIPLIGGKSFVLDPPYVSPLARGGIVSARAGGTLALIGEAGRDERVEPLDPNGLSRRDKALIDYLSGGAGGTTINVYPSPGMDERELAKKVSRELAFMMRRGSV